MCVLPLCQSWQRDNLYCPTCLERARIQQLRGNCSPLEVPTTPLSRAHSFAPRRHGVTSPPPFGLIRVDILLSEPDVAEQIPVSARLEAVAPEFAELYEAHSRQIFYLCLRLLGDPAKAEDATHDVFLKVWRKLDSFRGDSSIRTWIYQIALNHCRNLRQSWSERHIQTVEEETLLDSVGPGGDSPLRVLELKELGERIQTTLDRLTPEYRLLLLLVADEELSYDDIAALTEQTSDAVRGKLHRARKAFAAEFARTA